MTSLPTTMKAWVVTGNGAPSSSTLQLKTDVAAPGPPTGANILVKVTHAALNPVDLHFINILPPWLPFRRSPVPACDFAGEVVALGPAVPPTLRDTLKVGTPVCAAIPFTHMAAGRGTLAEYITVAADLVAVKPDRVSPAQAAGLMGIAGQTAALMAREASVEPGQRALVNGASGGVGSILVQALRAKGLAVFGVCSGANADMVKGLGAEDVIDYTKHTPLEGFLAERFKDAPLDVIFDCAGSQALFSHSAGYLKPKGKFVSIVGGASQGVVPFVRNKMRPVFLGGTPRSFSLLLLLPSGRTANEIAQWVRDELVKDAVIDSVFEMEDAVKAYEKLASKHAKGKIIVKVAA